MSIPEKKFLAALVGLGLAGVCGPAWASDWESFGPEPISGGDTGRIMSIAAHPTEAETLYVGAASGGVWKKTGDKWIPVTNKLPAASIGALALDPENPDTIYAGSGEPTYATHAFYGLGMYKSTDAGKTWKVIGKKAFAGRTFGRILVHPKKTKRLFAAVLTAGTPKNHPLAEGDVGVMVSEDAGKTWNKVEGLPNTMASDIEFAPDDPETMYAAMASYEKLTGLFKTTDGGKTWKRIGEGTLPSTGKFRIAVTKADPKKIWVVGTNNKIYRSDDAGGSFRAVSASGFRVQGWYDIDIAVDPSDANAVYAAGVNLLRTTNNGSSWSRVTPPHVDLQVLDFDASGNLLCGGDGGIHRSKNKGSRWEVIGKGISNIQIYAGMSTHPTNKNFFLGGLQDNGTVVRSTESLAWKSVLGGDGGTTLVNPDSPEIMFAQIQNTASLYRSSDGGRSFRKAASGIRSSDRVAFYAPIALDPKDPNIVYYPAQRLYKSTNGGSSYSAISGDVTGGGRAAMRSFAVSPVDSKYMYAGTTDDRVVVSTDGGKTFKVSLKDSPGYPRVARAISAAPWGDGKVAFKGVGAFGTDQVIMTEDAGESWKGVDGDLPDVPVNSVAAFQLSSEGMRGTKLLLAGSDQGVYLNCDLDGHWRKVGKLLPNVPVHDIRYDKFHQRIVAGTFGRGAWAHSGADGAFFEKLCMETESPDPSQDSEGGEDTEGESSGDSGVGSGKESEGGGSNDSSSENDSKGKDSEGDSGKGDGSGDGSGDASGSKGSGNGDSSSKDPDKESGCMLATGLGGSEMLPLFGLGLIGLGLRRRRS